MPRNWDQAYEEDDTPWDKGYAAPPLTEYLETHTVAGRVLVPGCGTGHDVRALAAQGAEVVGMDIAPSALKKAKAFPSVGNELYELGDFLNPDTGHLAKYDWVFEHTCLCAIEPEERSAYAEALLRLLNPGGRYLAIFFREVSDYDGDGPPHPISKKQSDMLFTEDFELVESYIPQVAYPSRPIGAEEICVWQKKITKRTD